MKKEKMGEDGRGRRREELERTGGKGGRGGAQQVKRMSRGWGRMTMRRGGGGKEKG